jgi:hypothetical protein
MGGVSVSVIGLWTYAVTGGGGTVRQPLTSLGSPENAGHVHGRLTIMVVGRLLPYLGHLGPDDVCLDTWVVELCRVVNDLAMTPSTYVFDEGEQGQPAFRFERCGHEVAISIVDSDVSDGEADHDWQDVRCDYGALRDAVAGFLQEQRRNLRNQAPHEAERWWPREAALV